MQQSLCLISLSNYVFVLEISQISGIVQNVSMLIMVVMRIVAVVGEEKRKGEGESLEPKALHGPNPFIKYKYLVTGDVAPSFVPGIHRENVTFACETLSTHLPSPLHRGVHLFVADHKKVPFDFPALCVSCKSVTALGM